MMTVMVIGVVMMMMMMLTMLMVIIIIIIVIIITIVLIIHMFTVAVVRDPDFVLLLSSGDEDSTMSSSDGSTSGTTTQDSGAYSYEPSESVLEFRNRLLQELCWYYLDAHLCLNTPDRRTSSARLTAAERQQHKMDADRVRVLTVARLADLEGSNLQRDYAYLETALRGPIARNDIAWITGAPEAFCLLLAKEFEEHFVDNDRVQASHFANLAKDLVLPLLHHGTLCALWPLLSKPSQGKLQRWFQQHITMLRRAESQAAGLVDEEMEPPERKLLRLTATSCPADG